jgi:hypothetical protein
MMFRSGFVVATAGVVVLLSQGAHAQAKQPVVASAGRLSAAQAAQQVDVNAERRNARNAIFGRTAGPSTLAPPVHTVASSGPSFRGASRGAAEGRVYPLSAATSTAPREHIVTSRGPLPAGQAAAIHADINRINEEWWTRPKAADSGRGIEPWLTFRPNAAAPRAP